MRRVPPPVRDGRAGSFPRGVGDGRIRPLPSVVIARTPGVSDRTQAERLRGVRLFLERGQLPEAAEDEFYHADLIGLAVELGTGERIGVVAAVQDFGAGALLEVRHERGSTLLPFTRAVVPRVDLAARRLVVTPPPGLLPAERAGSEG